jgi:hypothetical protein
MDDRVRDGVEKLLQFPLSGRSGRVDDTRETPVLEPEEARRL